MTQSHETAHATPPQALDTRSDVARPTWVDARSRPILRPPGSGPESLHLNAQERLQDSVFVVGGQSTANEATMKKILFTALVVGLLVPTAAFAAAPAQNPASYCKAHAELIERRQSCTRTGGPARPSPERQAGKPTPRTLPRRARPNRPSALTRSPPSTAPTRTRTNAFGKCVSKTRECEDRRPAGC